MTWPVTFTIYGQVHSKANSRRLVRFGGRVAFIKSTPALAFETAAVRQLQALWRGREPLTGELAIEVTIHYSDQRRDLDASLVFDCLQKAGVIKNDRGLREQHLYHAIDKLNPRAVIKLWPRDLSTKHEFFS